MSGHIFLSYAMGDRDYAQRLASHLIGAGIKVWDDEPNSRTDFGATMVDTAAAVVVVMSPEAEQSDFVTREILRAIERRIPIFPLLLAGRGLFLLTDHQFEDVSGGRMPSERFLGAVSLAVTFPLTRPVQPAFESAEAQPVPAQRVSAQRVSAQPAATTAAARTTVADSVAVEVPDHYAMFAKIYDEIRAGRRTATRQLVLGALLGLPVGVLGSYLASLLGWG